MKYQFGNLVCWNCNEEQRRKVVTNKTSSIAAEEFLFGEVMTKERGKSLRREYANITPTSARGDAQAGTIVYNGIALSFLQMSSCKNSNMHLRGNQGRYRNDI